MRTAQYLGLMGVFVGAALLAGVVTWTLRARAVAATQPASGDLLLNWLNVSAGEREELAKHDVNYESDLARLRSQLSERKSDLAATLEKPGSADQAIREGMEAVIAANDALQRRVVEHLLLIRDHLTPAQQQQLLSLCAEGLRQGPRGGWRGGERGGRGGQGGGRGGQGYRGGRGSTTAP